MQLSAKAARDLQPGQTLHDHVVKGLSLRARAEVKTWHLFYRVSGSQRRPAIGRFPAMSLEMAREVAKDWQRRIALGEDPSADRQDARRAPTVADLVAYHFDNVVPTNYSTDRSRRDATNAIKSEVLPAWGARKVADITVQDAVRLVTAIGQRAPVRANRVKAYASRMFQVAESTALAWRPKRSNPFRDPEVPHYTERKRRVHLTAEEFQRLKVALEHEARTHPRHVACIYCILFCGTRVTEMATARTAWRRGRVLELPDTEHKTGRHTGDVRVIVLPDQAVAMINALPNRNDGYVFGAGLSQDNIWEVFNRARIAAGVPHIQPRDLRRTFASVAKTRGASLSQIGDIFDHGNPATTARYAFLFDEARSGLVQSTADEISRLMGD